MGIDLNKGGEDISKLKADKKGLNLSKKGDSEKGKINLGKERVSEKVKVDLEKGDVDTKVAAPAPSQNNSSSKSPIAILSILVILICLGGFWYLNQDDSKVDSESTSGGAAPDTPIEQQVTPIESQPTVTVKKEENAAQPTENSVMESNQGKSKEVDVPNESPTKSNPNNSGKVSANPSSSNSSVGAQNSLEEKARQVLAGVFGNGEERKQALGGDYAQVQAKVNEIVKNASN